MKRNIRLPLALAIVLAWTPAVLAADDENQQPAVEQSGWLPVTTLGDARLKHWARASVIGFGRDDETVVSAGQDGTVRVWDVATGRQVHLFDEYSGGGWGVAIMPDGRQLVMETPGGIQIIDLATGDVQRTLPDSVGGPSLIALSADGQWLATQCEMQDGMNRAHIRDLKTGNIRCTVTGGQELWRDLDLSPDGSRLAVSADADILLFDAVTAQLVRHIPDAHRHQDQGSTVYPVRFHPDGSMFVSGGAVGNVKFWSAETGIETATIVPDHNTVSCLAFSPDGTRLARGGGELAVWNVKTKQQLVFDRNTKPDSIAFSSDGRLLAISVDNRIEILGTVDWKPREFPEPITGAADFTAAAIHPRGEFLLTGSRDGALALWNFTKQRLEYTLKEHSGRVRRVAVSPDGRFFASAADDRKVFLWDVKNRRLRREFRGSGFSFSAIAFSADGRYFAWRHVRDGVIIWNLNDDVQHAIAPDDEYYVRGRIALDATGEKLYAAGRASAVVWDVRGKRLTQSFGGTTRFQDVPLALSPQDRFLAAAGTRGNVVDVWKAATGDGIALAIGPSRRMWSLVFNDDETVLAASGEDGKVHFWELPIGKETEPLVLGPSAGAVHKVQFAANDHYLLTLNGNGTVSVFERVGE